MAWTACEWINVYSLFTLILPLQFYTIELPDIIDFHSGSTTLRISPSNNAPYILIQQRSNMHIAVNGNGDKAAPPRRTVSHDKTKRQAKKKTVQHQRMPNQVTDKRRMLGYLVGPRTA
jgi:hypothetical protein